MYYIDTEMHSQILHTLLSFRLHPTNLHTKELIDSEIDTDRFVITTPRSDLWVNSRDKKIVRTIRNEGMFFF